MSRTPPVSFYAVQLTRKQPPHDVHWMAREDEECDPFEPFITRVQAEDLIERLSPWYAGKVIEWRLVDESFHQAQ
jgi:hypothetical protein